MEETKKFMEPLDIDNGWRDWDMGNKAQEFYRDYLPSHVNCERGETWFTPIALLEGVGNCKKINRICPEFKIEGIKKGDVKKFKLELISKISEVVMEHDDRDLNKRVGEAYHSLVNFGCIPLGLNSWKGFRNRCRLGDFPDLFLQSVKIWFLNAEPKPNGSEESRIEGYSTTEKDEFDRYKELWFHKFGKGEAGWRKFVLGEMLMGSFVDSDYNVIQLFDHKIGRPFPDISEITGSGKKYTKDELAVALSQVQVIRGCILEIYKIWYNRAIVLSKHKE
ncbi:MAG: hypothetical protein WC977_04630 [Anaerovoracaceae bacterium]